MKKFLLITNTDWREVPRVRHQIAFLLRDNKINVYFFERRKGSNFPRTNLKNNKGSFIKVVNLFFRIHPKFRIKYFSSFLSFFDSLRIRLFCLRNKFFDNNELYIINFCQEIFHLPLLFPHSRHSLFIHDDFISQTNNKIFKAILKDQLTNVLDVYRNYSVLCSSLILIKKVNQIQFIKNLVLFYPWPQNSFKGNLYSSYSNISRRILLYWGVKNNSLDWDFLKNIENEIINKGPLFEYIDKVLLVGPWAKNEMALKSPLLSLKRNKVIIDMKASEFSQLPIKRVLAGIIPFQEGCNKSLIDVELANKSFSFLEYGIPLIIKGLPNFIEKSFFPKINNVEELYSALKSINNELDLKREIQIFYHSNSAQVRFNNLMSSMN